MSVPLPVNLVEARLMLQADLWPCGSANICKISGEHLTEKSKVAQQAYEGHMAGCDKATILKFKVKAIVGNSRN